MSRPVYIDGELWAEAPDDMTDEEVMAYAEENYRGARVDVGPQKGILGKAADELNAFLYGAGDWASMGGVDEVYAAWETGKELATGKIKIGDVGRVFHEHAGVWRAEQRRQADKSPIATAAGRTVGGAAPLVLTGGASTVPQTASQSVTAAKAAPTLTENMAKAASWGAGAGGLSGETPEDRALGSVVGATTGAAIAGAPAAYTVTKNALADSPIGKGVKAVKDSIVPQPATRRAAKLILKAGGGDRQKMVESAEKTYSDLRPRAGGPVEETVAETMGPNVEGLARAVATVPGPGRVQADAMLAERHKGIGDRIMQAVTQGTGKKRGDVVEMVKEMQALRREQARLNYDRAHNAAPPEDADFLVAQVIESDVGRAGAREGASLLDKELARTADAAKRAVIKQDKAYLQAMSKPRAQWTDADAAAAARGPSMRSLDYLQRGMGSVAEAEYRSSPSAGSATEAAQKRLVEALKEASPEFKAAHNTYREGSRPIDYAELGRKSLKMSDLELTEQLGDMSAADEDAFAAGVAQAFSEALDKGEKTVIRKFNEQPGFKRILQSAFSPEAYKGLEARLAREAKMLDTNLGVRRRADALRAGEDIAAAADEGPADKFVAEVISGGGNVKGPMLRRAGKIYQAVRRPGIHNKDVNREVTNLMWQKATPENLRRLDNFLLEHGEPYQVKRPNVGLDGTAAGVMVQPLDPHGRTQDFKAARDGLAADPKIQFDPADGPVPEFTPGPNRRGAGAGGPDAQGQSASPSGINYNAQGDNLRLELSDDGEWVNDPVSGVWRKRRPNDRTRPNQTLNVDITQGQSL